jgi:phage-related protein
MGVTEPYRLRELTFLGDAREALRHFPGIARYVAGRELERVQRGGEPNHWKPMNSVGPGVREIRIRDAEGIYRVLYVARFADHIFVLHCFQKKTQKTSSGDLELARRRYKDLVKEFSR